MRYSKAVCLACVLAVLGATGVGAQSSTSVMSPPAVARERVTGIGGFFFRASDPKALADWYERHLGVTRTPQSYDVEPWRQEGGRTAFAPFPPDTKYFGRPQQQWMINFRVRDLDAMVTQLRKAGIAVTVDTQSYPNGRFGRLDDPEGNPIQLWEPRDPRTGGSPD